MAARYTVVRNTWQTEWMKGPGQGRGPPKYKRK